MQASDVNSQQPRGRRRSLSHGSASDLVGLPTATPFAEGESSYSKIRNLLRPRSKTSVTIEAIHDIDSNLIFISGEYNKQLGKSFSGKKITRNVFCSDMGRFSKSDITVRCEARDHFAQTYKFDTYAIIIPPDYAWHLDSKVLDDFDVACRPIDLRAKKNLHLIDEILKNPAFERIAFLIKPDKTPEEIAKLVQEQVEPGTAFAELEKNYSLALAEKARHAKWIIDLAAYKAELLGIKGLLLRKFFKNNEGKVCNFVFTDDKAEEIDAVIIESANWPTARVTGIITPADEKECTRKFYDSKLEASINRSSQQSSDEEASLQRRSGSITPPVEPLKNKSRSAGDSPEEKLPDTSLRASQRLGKFG